MFAFHQSRARGHGFREEAGALDANQVVTATSFADEACPVVFRDSSMRQILAFEHPDTGLQLVKGGIENGEDAGAAALRELEEEAGIANMSIARDLGTWSSGHDGHVWSLQLCTYSPKLPDTWTHEERRFLWQDMHREPDRRWADQYRRALATIRERARALRWRG
jgi:8-oxo-dGTP pyrophosphatase MutT (NUDIX family)